MPLTRAVGSASSSRTPLPTSPKAKNKANPSAAPKVASPYFSRASSGADPAPATTAPAPPQGPADGSLPSHIKIGRRGAPKRRLDTSPGPRPSSSPRKQRREDQASNTSASVFSKEHTSVRGSPNTSHGSIADGAHTKLDIVEELHKQFRQFPTGEIAYGHTLQTQVLPQIQLKDLGVFNLPLDNQQLAEIRKLAHQPYAGKFGADWPFNTAHRLTATIPPDSFEIVNSEEWNVAVAQLATNAGMYLGFGQMSSNIEFKPGSLYLWEKDGIWRGYGR